jgi:uncharacterized membrane protein YeaQ/YmgE (transglycosylase-associated protein family)
LGNFGAVEGFPTRIFDENFRGKEIGMSAQSLLIFLLVGAVAGWLAGVVVRGGGFGLLGDIVVGILGAFIAGWLFPQLGFHLAVGIVGVILDAAIGAIVLLLIIRVIRRA